MTQSFSSGESTITMSDQSAEHFGAWAQEFATWAETQRVGQVVLITPEDILGDNSLEDLSREEAQALFLDYFEQNHPDFPLKSLADEDDDWDIKLRGLVQNAVQGRGRADSVDVDGDGQNDFGIVIATSINATKAESAARFSGLDPADMQSVPGTNLEWQIFTIAHEIGHLSQPEKSSGMNLVWEIEAEQDMVNFMRSANEKGMLSDPAILDDFTLIRNLKSFYFGDDLRTHVVGPGVQTPSESSPAPVGAQDIDFQDPLHAAQSKVSFDVGKDLITDDHRREALRDMLSQRGIYSFQSSQLPMLSPQDREILRDMAFGDMAIEEGLAALPDNISEKIEENFEGETRVLGIGALMDDPALMFNTTRRLYLEGAFDDDPIGKQYAYEFLTAAQKFAPETFGVFNEDEILTPPTFPETDAATPTGQAPDLDRTLLMPGTP